MVDKAPLLSIRIDFWILLSDTICQLIQFYTNREAAMLSTEWLLGMELVKTKRGKILNDQSTLSKQ